MLRTFVVLWTTACMCSACTWFQSDTKEQYLHDYDAFITDFSTEHPQYSESDWQNTADKLYELSGERYQQFAPTPSYREKLVLQKWAIMVPLMRYKQLAQTQITVEYARDSETLLNGLREIMDSTYTVYDGFDNDMRDLLFKLKPCP
ncbi:MAG: hypothetical protein IPL33_09965 [Sphingobacteriales bacterium]|nr:hypothetical protein [Sphingobacteriales bacterium]